MHLLSFLYPILIVLVTLLEPAAGARKTSDGVLLTQVKTLTLRQNAKTSHRRVPAIPQLKCVGGNGRGHYEVDIMRCKNQGSDYNDENVQWTCTANLPEEFRLGATDVICEGYDSPRDPYILKGSCGVEYRLLLTKKGEERYGKGRRLLPVVVPGLDWNKLLFWVLFTAVTGWIVYSAWLAYHGAPRARRPPRSRGFWGGGWGGGGGNDPYDPPPPYPGRKPYSSSASTFGQDGWRPGFWSGVLGGATAGYLAGNRGGRSHEAAPPRAGSSNWFENGYNTGDRLLNSRRPRSNSGSSARYESTGFGSSSRR